MDHPLGVRLGAEALGTFLFFFLGFSGIAVVVDIGAEAITPLGVAAGFGFGLALAITAFGHLSGGHFNPAVSAGLAVAGKFPGRDVVPYWIAQLVGGFGAVLVMAIVYSSDVTDALHTQPGSGIDNWAALVLEIIATALFVMVILTVATDDRAAWKGVMAPFLIGLFIFTAAVTVGPASGGSFNPARSLDPVLYNQEWGDVWIYIVGPLAGTQRLSSRTPSSRDFKLASWLDGGDREGALALSSVSRNQELAQQEQHQNSRRQRASKAENGAATATTVRAHEIAVATTGRDHDPARATRSMP
jgi:aquaporin Z